MPTVTCGWWSRSWPTNRCDRSSSLRPGARAAEGTEGTDTGPRLLGVRVSADGLPVERIEVVADAEGLVVPLPTSATRLELTYEVVGAESRRPAAPATRVTLSLQPATRLTFDALPVVTALDTAVVLTVVCPDAPPKRRPCGIDRGDTWRTRRMPASQSAVVALVDLGPASGAVAR